MNKLAMAVCTLAVAGAMVGCTSVNVYREGDVDPQEFLTDTSNNPYHIDWTVGAERVKGSGSATCWFWFFGSNDGRHMDPPGFSFGVVKSAKEAATFDAVEAAQADTLVGALYRYTTTSKWLGIYKSVECDVVGFPAYVKSIELTYDRPVLLDKDVQIIRLKNWEKLGK